jgi:hypothetical protein
MIDHIAMIWIQSIDGANTKKLFFDIDDCFVDKLTFTSPVPPHLVTPLPVVRSSF